MSYPDPLGGGVLRPGLLCRHAWSGAALGDALGLRHTAHSAGGPVPFRLTWSGAALGDPLGLRHTAHSAGGPLPFRLAWSGAALGGAFWGCATQPIRPVGPFPSACLGVEQRLVVPWGCATQPIRPVGPFPSACLGVEQRLVAPWAPHSPFGRWAPSLPPGVEWSSARWGLLGLRHTAHSAGGPVPFRLSWSGAALGGALGLRHTAHQAGGPVPFRLSWSGAALGGALGATQPIRPVGPFPPAWRGTGP